MVRRSSDSAGQLTLKHLDKSFDGRAVVRDVSLDVAAGEFFSLLGPSGCGKTTTLRMIAGLEAPSGGQIFIDGCDVTPLGPAQRNVSLVFQSYALFPHMDVLGNVTYGLRMSGLDKDAACTKAQQALHGVGLTGFDARLPAELSGGQQQRVALARALVLEPAVLLFDEPLSNLDARLRREMREEIRSLQQRLQLTVAYVTHEKGEALAVSDHIIVMDRGHIAQAGSPRKLYEEPATEFVASFMGDARLFPATADAQGRVQLGPLALMPRQPVAPGPVKVAVRPEAWQLCPAGTGLAGRLAKIAYLGSGYELTFETPLGQVFVLSPDPSGRWAPGDEVGLDLPGTGISVLPMA